MCLLCEGIIWELFDPEREWRVTAGNLPHWYQPGVTYFITIRTEDSIPHDAADLWHRRREDWLLRHGIDPKHVHWQAALRTLPDPAQREFHSVFSREFEQFLDRGLGACPLSRRPLAHIVADSLLHFDRQRYYLGDFVIMPNHVHLLTCLLGDTDIEQQCYSWKKFTATRINRALERQGRFWQEESFDHLVRNAEEFEYLQHYIAHNPIEARLHEGSYLLRRSTP